MDGALFEIDGACEDEAIGPGVVATEPGDPEDLMELDDTNALNEAIEPGKRSLVVLANRLPVREVGDEGDTHWEISPGGLVSALVPILQQRGGGWVGWSGRPGAAPPPFELEGIHNSAVELSPTLLEGHYEGFSNRSLWPLYHDSIRPSVFRRRWWRDYVHVNRLFAEAAAGEAKSNATVWVHDYHLQLVPRMLRSLRPDLRIGFFLHIPFPPHELFAQIPWRRQIIEGMLGADLVGFQTKRNAQNFAHVARRYSGVEGTQSELRVGPRLVRVGHFPVSINTKRFETAARDPQTITEARRIRSELGTNRRIILGVDRMDYTKGIDIRLKAFGELLDSGLASVSDCVLVQIAVPSREEVDDYSDMNATVEQLVGQINGAHGNVEGPVVHYFHRTLPFQELVAFYLAADVILVTPLRDGMNLIAKEYVASRVDNKGVLILSEFAGAANELNRALLVNPHDVDGLVASLDQALKMPADEVGRRMRVLRRQVRTHDVFGWARSYLGALEA